MHCNSNLSSEYNLWDSLYLIAEELTPEFKLIDLITPYDYKEFNIDWVKYLKSDIEILCNMFRI